MCANYRPISLLNSDVKLFSKILASRLIKLVPGLIHWDQVGFIPSREARDNVIRTVDLMAHAKYSGMPFLLLSTDAEKAFNRVSWGFIEATLNYLGLGQKMRTNIMALYSNPVAQVVVNGGISTPFALRNGTRQGCPLSPVIFALTLEPLLCNIRNNPDIRGIKVGPKIHKVSAYADNLIFYVSSPEITLPNIIQELRTIKNIWF